MILIKQTAMFFLGGTGYVGLEYLWRGRSHISMFLAGGICFLLLGKLEKTVHRPPLKAAAGMLSVTGVEFLFGLAVNRDHTVWDYRRQPCNILGQVCPQFMLLWLPLSIFAMKLHNRLEQALPAT
jgi:uncharacterized membrane protein